MSTVLEQTDAHPFITAYYQDPRRFALETELAFMAIHLHQIKCATGPIVSDFSPAKNLIYGAGQLEGADLAALRAIDQHLWRDLPPPAVALFLDVPTDVCLKRLQRRGRPFEQGITIEDLNALRHGYLASLTQLAVEVVRFELSGDESPEIVAKLASESIDRHRA